MTKVAKVPSALSRQLHPIAITKIEQDIACFKLKIFAIKTQIIDANTSANSVANDRW